MREGKPMINFTVGPVQSCEEVLKIGSVHTPYFRTQEFSDIMFENEALMKKFANVEESGRVAFMTGSGTASMEAVVANFFDERDKVLVVNGGGFGQRFAELCELYKLDFTSIHLGIGMPLTEEDLKPYENQGYTGLLVNIHETSTGVHYDLEMIAEFCRRKQIFFIVDAISAFLADEVDMQKNSIDVMITGSQKALACPPGVSIIVMNERAVKRLEDYPSRCMYLDIKTALKDGARGQTPFTPAVTILLQIHARLKQIEAAGGAVSETKRIHELAEYFRGRLQGLPFELFTDHLSNAVTPLRPTTCSANEIFLRLKDEYGIWICPNGGDLKDTLFRVGHIGELCKADYDELIEAFADLKQRGII